MQLFNTTHIDIAHIDIAHRDIAHIEMYMTLSTLRCINLFFSILMYAYVLNGA